MTGDRLDFLLMGHEDGRLTATEEAELVALLRTPEARRRVVEHYLMSEELAERRVPSRVRRPAIAAAAVVMLGAAAALALVLRPRPPAPLSAESDPHLERVFEREKESPHGRDIPRFVVGEPASTGVPESAEPPPVPVDAEILAHAQPRGLGAELAAAPPKSVSRLRAWKPDARNMFLYNQPAFECSGHQRFGLDTLMVGSVLRNEGYVAQGWAVIEATFAYQRDDGSFGDHPVCVAMWMGFLGVALDTLERGPFAVEYRPRIRALEPALRRAATWLARPASLASLQRGGPETATPDFIGAGALASLAVRLEEPSLLAAAVTLAEHGLGDQNADGAFLHQRAPDSLFHVHRTLQLHMLIATLPLERYKRAARRAGEWALARVLPDGALDLTGNTANKPCDPSSGARCRHVPYRELRWLLTLHGARFDSGTLPVADEVFQGEARRAR